MSLIQQFYDVVSEMHQQTEALLKLAREKKEVLVRGDVKALSAIIGQETVHIRSMGKLEDVRLQVGAALAKTYVIPKENITLTWLQQVATDVERKNLSELSEKYQVTIHELQELNLANRKLIEQSLNYVDHMLDIITGSDLSQSENYKPELSPAGQAQVGVDPRRRSFFDHKI